MALLGVEISAYLPVSPGNFSEGLEARIKNEPVGIIGMVDDKALDRFAIKQPVFFADLYWDKLMNLNKKIKIQYTGITKYPAVQRDLAIIVDKSLPYEAVEKTTQNAKVNKLTRINLFDIFESEKLGNDKKSMAINFTFSDPEKTLTDKEVDGMMSKIIGAYEQELNAQVRK